MVPFVVCVRDPDASNDFRVFGGEVKIIDVDLGRSNLASPDEFREWRESQEAECAQLRDLEIEGADGAAAFIEQIVCETAEAFGHEQIREVH